MNYIIKEWMAVHLFELQHVAHWILDHLKDNQIFLLSGAMGAGKTSFMGEYLRCCGITDFEGSPTYNYYNLYPIPAIHKDLILIHMDMYRLSTDDTMFQTEFEDLQILKSVFFIENYNPHKGLLLNHYLVIYFEEIDPERRRIWIEGKR